MAYLKYIALYIKYIASTCIEYKAYMKYIASTCIEYKAYIKYIAPYI